MQRLSDVPHDQKSYRQFDRFAGELVEDRVVLQRNHSVSGGAFALGISGLAERAASGEFSDAGIDGWQIDIFWIKDATILGDESFAMRWGLIRCWWNKGIKDVKMATFNVRVETVETKPFFRDTFKHTRCLIPGEWHRVQAARLTLPR